MSKKMPGIEVICNLLPKKKFSHYPPPMECGWLMVMGRNPKISATTPPPTESGRLTVIPENFCYYPPPTESGRPPEITENWPPPKKNPGYAVGSNRCTKLSLVPCQFSRVASRTPKAELNTVTD